MAKGHTRLVSEKNWNILCVPLDFLPTRNVLSIFIHFHPPGPGCLPWSVSDNQRMVSNTETYKLIEFLAPGDPTRSHPLIAPTTVLYPSENSFVVVKDAFYIDWQFVHVRQSGTL